MTSARDLTQALGGRWHGRYGTAPCPVCQPERSRGQNALTVADGRNGRPVLDCKKSACGFTDILAAVGMRSGDYRAPDAATLAQREREAKAETEKRAAQAGRLWHEAQPIAGTVAETYLRGRRIICELPRTLRFHPECWHGPTSSKHPAMIAMVEGADGCAIHRTYLRADGTGKAALTPDKMMLGCTRRGAVRITQGPGPLLIGEGIESTLSALILRGDSTVTAWASLSTSGMRGLRLPSVGSVGKVGTLSASLIVAVDGEKAGRDAGRELAERAAGLGWQVGILDPGDGCDFNDRLIEERA